MKPIIATLWLAILLALSACGPPPGSAPPAPDAPDTPATTETGTEDTAVVDPTAEPLTEPAFDIRPATINDFEILILESFPVQIHVAVSGMLGGSCASLGEVRVATGDDNSFHIEIDEIIELNVPCTRNLVPFEENVSLPVEGLPAGEYQVRVNEAEPQSFTLQIDNVLNEEKPVSGGQAYITAVTVTTLNEAEGRATVQVQGDLSNGCTAIEAIIVSGPEENTFTAEIATSQPADLMCTEALVPFTQTILLEELNDLAPGTYRIVVGGMAAEFELTGAESGTDEPDLAIVNEGQREDSARSQSGYERTPVSSLTIHVDEATQIATILVSGELPDGCEGVEPDPAGIMLVSDNELRLDVVRTVPEGVMCPMVITPYEKLITVDVSTLPAGEYTLVVNEATAVFTIPATNG